MYLAAGRGHADVVSALLLELGADVNAPSAGGWTALQVAAYRGHARTVQVLVSCGAALDHAHNQLTALMCAATKGHADCVKALCEAGANTGLQTAEGKTAQDLWIQSNGRTQAEIVALLDPSGFGRVADKVEPAKSAKPVKPVSQRPLTASELKLLDAVWDADAELVKTCLREGADPNAQDEDGQSTLILAVMGGDVECVRLLLAAGADRGRGRTVMGKTALEAAEELGHAEIVKLLSE